MAISLEEYEKRKKKKQQEQYNIISLEDYQKQKGIKSSLNNENDSIKFTLSIVLFFKMVIQILFLWFDYMLG